MKKTDLYSLVLLCCHIIYIMAKEQAKNKKSKKSLKPKAKKTLKKTTKKVVNKKKNNKKEKESPSFVSNGVLIVSILNLNGKK